MAKLNEIGRNTANAISELMYGGKPRTYLGMSVLGEECLAKTWLTFHWAATSKHSAKTERTFNLGHSFEKIIIQQLKDAGMQVFKILENEIEEEMFGGKDEVQETLVGFAGHAMGHSDGRVRGVIEAPKTVHLLELKTANDTAFKGFVKLGCKGQEPKYFYQTQRYMKAKKLTRTLFIVINKNTSELHIERIDEDKSVQDDLIRKEQHLIISHEIPTRVYPIGFYKCGISWCAQSLVCRGEVNPLRTCRTCEFGNIEDHGKWSCEKHKKELSSQEQWNSCPDYLLGWEIKDTGVGQDKEDVKFSE